MGKRQRGDGDNSRVKELSYENKKLRKEILKLRNQIDHNYCSRCDGGEQSEETHEESDGQVFYTPETSERNCHKCPVGILVIVKYTKLNGDVWYFRKCDKCRNRTVGKKYTSDVKD